jgi:hypothetical protein
MTTAAAEELRAAGYALSLEEEELIIRGPQPLSEEQRERARQESVRLKLALLLEAPPAWLSDIMNKCGRGRVTPKQVAAAVACTVGAHDWRGEVLEAVLDALKPKGMGLAAKWSREYGYVSIHDTTGEWWDVSLKDAPQWALGEARRRKELYGAGDKRAYRLTSQEMEELWEREQLVYDDVAEEEGAA